MPRGKSATRVARPFSVLHAFAQCRAAGMDDYLSKPIDRAALFATVRKWLAAGRRGDPARLYSN